MNFFGRIINKLTDKLMDLEEVSEMIFCGIVWYLCIILFIPFMFIEGLITVVFKPFKKKKMVN